jgi:uncharacterized membrane protein
MKAKFYETAARSVTKATTFRVLVIVSDIIVVFFLTHKYDLVISVVVFTNIASMVLYIFHERIWNLITWGKKAKKK